MDFIPIKATQRRYGAVKLMSDLSEAFLLDPHAGLKWLVWNVWTQDNEIKSDTGASPITISNLFIFLQRRSAELLWGYFLLSLKPISEATICVAQGKNNQKSNVFILTLRLFQQICENNFFLVAGNNTM